MCFDAELRRDFARRYPAANAHATRETANERDRALQLRAAISLDEFPVRNVKHSFSETDREEVLEAEPVLNEEDYHFSRTTFEELLTPLVDRTVASCDELLERAGVERTQLKRIVMVGGSCRLPLVRARLAGRVGAAPIEILWRRVGDRDMKPEVEVACGAALGPRKDTVPDARILGHLSRLVPQRVLSGTLGSGLRRLGDALVGMEWESGLAVISAADGSVLWRLPNIRLKHLSESSDPARLVTARFTVDLQTGELGPAPSRDVIASVKQPQESRADAWGRFCEGNASLQVHCASPSDRFRLFEQADGALGLAIWSEEWSAEPLSLIATFQRFRLVAAFRDESALFLFSGKSLQWVEYSIAKRGFVDQGQLSGKFAGSGTPRLCALNGQLALRVCSELVLAKLPNGPWRSFPFSEQELNCSQDIVAANGTLFIAFSTSAGYSVTHWRLLTVNSTTTPIPSIENVDEPLSDDEGPRLRQLESAPSRCREY